MRTKRTFADYLTHLESKIAIQDNILPAYMGGSVPNGADAIDGEATFKKSLGILRKNMPQIKSEDFGGFLKYARDKGIEVKRESIVIGYLQPAQSEYNPAKVAALPIDALATPLTVSEDNYVLDGTHRYVRILNQDSDQVVTVNRLMLPANDALALMHKYPKSFKQDVKQKNMAAYFGVLYNFLMEDQMANAIRMNNKYIKRLEEFHLGPGPHPNGSSQDVHGHGGDSKSSTGKKFADSSLDHVFKNGGLTVSIRAGNNVPTTGYVVAEHSSRGDIIDDARNVSREVLRARIKDYITKNRDMLSQDNMYMGFWLNEADGKLYLDVPTVIQDRQSAIDAGVKADQIAIWDIANGVEIPTGGSGLKGSE